MINPSQHCCSKNHFLVRIIVLLLPAALLILGLGQSVSAQQNFTPLKQGEYEVKEESEFFNPGIIVNGGYKAYYAAFKKGFVNGDYISDGFLQDIELKIRSKVNTNISVHAYIGNKSTLVSDQDDPFVTDYPDEASDATADGGMNLEFREAYLEYNHNPNARLLIGKQFINIADRIGMIYQGRANAVSQQCRIGTWCYYVGGARIGNNGESGLFWLQIDYPVYESGVLISDPWVEKGTRQEVSFNVELMRVDYRGTNIPMSKSGMWIGNGSKYQASYVENSVTKSVYFDNKGVQYMGFNLKWNYYDTLLRFTWLNLAGKREYFARSTLGKESIGEQSVAGNAYYLDTSYKFMKNWKTDLVLFASTGTDPDQNKNIWETKSDTYMEVQKGDFGNALIYFNGKEGLGDGHSISNLIFASLGFSFITDKEDVKIDFAAYSFKRNKPVFYTDTAGVTQKSTDIGTEFDFAVSWKLEEKLSTSFQLAYFNPGNAYSKNDNITPVESTESFSLIGLNIQYTF